MTQWFFDFKNQVQFYLHGQNVEVQGTVLFTIDSEEWNVEVRPGVFETIKAIVFKRSPTVAAIVWNRDANTVLLVNQFRAPAQQKLWELIAGIINVTGEDKRIALKREMFEEAGVEPFGEPEHIAGYFLSPGGSNEWQDLYLVTAQKTGDGGGLAEESEFITTHEMPVEQALNMVRDGRIKDAKTIIALQFIQLRMAGLV